jgi:DNA invertase Pin-like site-specific DNA recombinase
MKAYGYIRLSKEDRDSTSPQRQRQRIERLCADREWELVEVFSDIDVSAFNGKKRPAFNRMMASLADVDAIVFWRLDRLSRSVAEFARILEQTQAAGVQLVSTDQPIDTASAMGKAFVQISSVFAELEAGTTSERSRQMHAYKRERGEAVGRVPFGWCRVGKHHEQDPAQQAILREAAERYVAGETFSAIAKDTGLLIGPLSRMLRSQRVQAALPPELAHALASSLRARRGERTPTSKMSLLGGIATCAICGAGLRRSSTRAARSGRWYSYACPTPRHVHISGTWLETYVSEQVISAVDTAKLVEAIRRRQKVANPRLVSDLEARLEVLDEALEEGVISAADWKRRRGGLLEKLKAAQQRERPAPVGVLPAELARDLGKRWPGLSIEGRRRIIAAVLERVSVQKANGRGPITPDRVELVWR